MAFQCSIPVGVADSQWLSDAVPEVQRMAAYLKLSSLSPIPIAVYATRDTYATVNAAPDGVSGNSPGLARVEIVSPFAPDNFQPRDHMDKVLLHESAHVLTARRIPEMTTPEGYCEWLAESLAFFLCGWNLLSQPPRDISLICEASFKEKYHHALGFLFWQFIESEMGREGLLTGIEQGKNFKAHHLIPNFDARWQSFIAAHSKAVSNAPSCAA